MPRGNIYTFHVARRTKNRTSDISDLKDKYPIKNTQALILLIEEALRWISRAHNLFGSSPPTCLKARLNWLAKVEKTLKKFEIAIEEGKYLAGPDLGADVAWCKTIDKLLNAFPEDELGDEGDLYEVIDNLSSFWLDNIYSKLNNTRSVMSGDADVCVCCGTNFVQTWRFRDHCFWPDYHSIVE